MTKSYSQNGNLGLPVFMKIYKNNQGNSIKYTASLIENNGIYTLSNVTKKNNTQCEPQGNINSHDTEIEVYSLNIKGKRFSVKFLNKIRKKYFIEYRSIKSEP